MENFDEQQLYSLVLEYFKDMLQVPNAQLQIRGVIDGVEQKVKKMIGKTDYGHILSDAQHELINEITWDLIIQRILGIKTDGLPWVYVTEYGKKVVTATSPIPYDRENYLNNIYSKNPDLDESVKSYLEESLICFRGGAYRGSVVMLGVASERLFTVLVETFQKKLKINPPIISEKYRPFSQIRNDFSKKFNPTKKSLGSELTQDLDIVFDGIYTIIKNSRDNSGHPTGILVTRDQMFAYFSLFPMYVDRVCKLTAAYK